MEEISNLIESVKRIEIPNNHVENVFWAPRIVTCQSQDPYPGRHLGYTLYAYGGAVLTLFRVSEEIVYGIPFSLDYFKTDRDKGKSIIKDFKDRIEEGTEFLSSWTYMDDVLSAMDRREFGERRRENRIANYNSRCNDKYEIFDMEANTKTPSFDAKADIMWLNNETRPVISFVEYKCTDSAMVNPNYAPTGHYKKMVGYYQNEDVKERIHILLELKRLLNEEEVVDFENFDTEIVFLFSHINRTRHPVFENGVSEGNVKRRLYEMYIDNKEKIECHIKDLKFAFIKDENTSLESVSVVSAEDVIFESEDSIWESIVSFVS